MTRIENESKLSQSPSETQTEEEIAYELRKFMEEEANSISLERIPRRGFLKRMVQVSLPAGVVLATAGEASACWICDESSGCQANCLFCQSGCVIPPNIQCGQPHIDGGGTPQLGCSPTVSRCNPIESR